MYTIYYDVPAKRWNEALPIGNGFTGTMIYGSLQKEKLCFNDGTLWSGYPKNYDSAESLKYLNEVRKLIFEGKNSEADLLCEKKLTGFYSEAFMPLGEIDLKFKNINQNQYARSLDMKNAIHTVSSDGCLSEAFSSNPDRVSVYRIKAKEPFSVKITAKSKLKSSVFVDGDSLFLSGNAPDYAAPNYLFRELYPIRYNEKKGMAFCLQTCIKTDGVVKHNRKSVTVNGARDLTLYFVTETGFNGFDQMPCADRAKVMQKCITAMQKVHKDFEVLKERHTADFSALFNAQSVSFGNTYTGTATELIKKVRSGENIKDLAELLYNYAKYMMISGSRKGGQPLNLQGIWNDSLRPPWSSNYTVNINTQMNYWFASRSGLSGCIEPLIEMVYETVQNGKKTAKVNYGCRGFACNHNVDLWRKTSPVKGSASYMFAPLCGVWLANEIYTHFKNGGLEEYKDKIRVIVTEAAKFACDFLVMHEGAYVICPSVSPENSFYHDSKKCKLDFGSAFDMGLVKQVFKNALEITEDDQLVSDIKQKAPLLYAFQTGQNGICEWHKEFEYPEKGHRHFSPLYSFYPGNLIGFYEDKKNTATVQKRFEHRLRFTQQHIGWSAAWAMCLAARLRDSKTFLAVMTNMFAHCVFENLFCVHPPNYFQIDGNLGFAAGINEMLLAEENGVIDLLPALPALFAQKGEVKNMLVSGAKISFKWQNGKVYEVISDQDIKMHRLHLSDDVFLGEHVKLTDLSE